MPSRRILVVPIVKVSPSTTLGTPGSSAAGAIEQVAHAKNETMITIVYKWVMVAWGVIRHLNLPARLAKNI
jgi:hypothetical protein